MPQEEFLFGKGIDIFFKFSLANLWLELNAVFGTERSFERNQRFERNPDETIATR
jgi:hypothetical protein